MTFLFLGLKVHFWYYKCSSILFIPFVSIEHVNMYLFLKSKFSWILLWFSKFYVKLGVVVKNFKITVGRWLFFFGIKSLLLKHTYMGYFWKSYSQSPTLHKITTVSLRGLAQIYTKRREAPSLRMDGWDGMGWNIKSVLQCSSYCVGCG